MKLFVGSLLCAGSQAELALEAKEYTGKFDCHSYLARYPDLMNAFGTNCNRAYDHFVYTGMGEGRSAVYTGKAFDCQGYLTRYPDLKAAFKGNCASAFNHYVKHGRHEGRDASENDDTFKCETYLARHDDLMDAFGHNCEAAFSHYLQYHIANDGKETREAADDNSIWHCESYLSKHRDLQEAFGNNCEKAFNHYVSNGRHEGRNAGQTGSNHFQCEGYLLRHADLRKAFGSDCVAAFSHYLSFGWKEGRDATTGLYNCNAYLGRYPGLRAAYGDDCDGAFQHYLNTGEKEGRNPTESLSNRVCTKPSLCNTEDGSNDHNLRIAIENPAGTMVLRQNGWNTEYQLNPTIEAKTEYEMVMWVAYSDDYNGEKNEFHFRYWDNTNKAYAIGFDHEKSHTYAMSAVQVVATKTVDGLTWKKERRVFTTPTQVKNTLQWYVGYAPKNSKGYRYISGIEFNKMKTYTMREWEPCVDQALCATESGSNNHNLLTRHENPAATPVVLRQNGWNTEYQLNPKINAGATYEMVMWVAYTTDYNGEKNEFHFRYWDNKRKAYAMGYDHESNAIGTKVEVLETKESGGLTWQKERRIFETPHSDSDNQLKFNWYVGYAPKNSKGYRYIAGIELNLLPRDCNGMWQEWTQCSKTCNAGVQTSTFKVIHSAKWGGKACSNKAGEKKSQACNKDIECPEDIDVEMAISETKESFTDDKKAALKDEIAKALGLRSDEVTITVGAKPNKVSRRLIGAAEGLTITVTIKVLASKVTEEVDTLASPTFATKVAAATGITATFQAFKPAHGSKICATCKWDGSKVTVVHYINAQKHGEKGLQHKCYHEAGKCKCACDTWDENFGVNHERPYKRYFPGPNKNTPGLGFPRCTLHTHKGKQSVWAMCGNFKVGQWGIGPEGAAQAIKNCDYASRTQVRWGECSKAVQEGGYHSSK